MLDRVLTAFLFARVDAARQLAISLRSLDKLISCKKIKIVKIGRRTMISPAELKKFAKRGTGSEGAR